MLVLLDNQIKKWHREKIALTKQIAVLVLVLTLKICLVKNSHVEMRNEIKRIFSFIQIIPLTPVSADLIAMRIVRLSVSFWKLKSIIYTLWIISIKGNPFDHFKCRSWQSRLWNITQFSIHQSVILPSLENLTLLVKLVFYFVEM